MSVRKLSRAESEMLPMDRGAISPVSNKSSTSDDLNCSIDMSQEVGDDERIRKMSNQNDDSINTRQDQDRSEALSGQAQGREQGSQTLESESSATDAVAYEPNNGCRQCVESRGECCRRNSTIRLELGLLYNNNERLRLKDFTSEIRASMDVEQFVHQADLMLDMTEVSIEDIVEAMLKKVISNNNKAPMTDGLSGAKEAILIPGSSMLLARTIQGVSSVVEPADRLSSTMNTLNYDQSWLCALCNLVQINRRHMIIARFKQPINMGDRAHEIRLFVLIVTPSKEKGTKNAVETGRTFATMLTDVGFRQKLLEAKSETDFKSLMMVRAQQLSKVKSMKNRHKYMLNAAVLHQSLSTLSDDKDNDQSLSRATTPAAQGKFGSSALGNMITNGTSGHRQPFDKNPRASKLFELLYEPTSQSIEDSKADKQEPNSRKRKDLSSYLVFLCKHVEFGKGLWNDFQRRVRHYPSDFKDAFVGPPKTIQKTVATIWFLYFGILLPTIAFSALNTAQTHGHMGDLRKAIIGQAIGGLGFAMFGGQPFVIIMTTAPLCLYTKAMYAAVGLWNGVFLTIYSLFGFSRLMKWCTRSTEEIFALFIVVAFILDASKDLMKNLNRYYYTPACKALNQTIDFSESSPQLIEFNASSSIIDKVSPTQVCRRETSLLFILLMLGTLWLATTLYKFNKTPYLGAGKRELLADYALPTAVIVMSFVGSYIFEDIYVEKFPPLMNIQFERAQIESLSLSGIFTSLGLGFTLSLLFFMDQNISAAMVNAPQNRLKKGCAYHFDLLVVGVLNGFLTLYGLPMMHGVLPHSPLHVRSLADIEERVEEGHLREVIVNVRETRVTGVVSHFLLLGSLLLIPYPIAYIPTAVLNGLFLYMAVTSLDGLQMFERILLLFTEQSKYPPNHYIRRCPQRKIHQFTLLQLLQLLVMCLFGFSPYNIVEMFFPVIILLMIPFRHRIVPKYVDDKYLDALDGKH